MWSQNSNGQNFDGMANATSHNWSFGRSHHNSNNNNNMYDGLAAELQGSDAFRTLFLGDLSYFCTEEDLCAIFAPFGSISTVRVRRGVTGESLMHGFIALDSHEAAKQAIAELDGKIFMGRSMRVQLSSEGPRPSAPKEGLVQIHVSFISKQLNFLVTEVILRDIFSPFGRIADVAVRRHTIVQKQNRQSGYGFVYFVDVDAACTAMAQLKQNTVREITFDCSISHKSEHYGKPNTPKSSDGQQPLFPSGSPVGSHGHRGVAGQSFNQLSMHGANGHSSSFTASNGSGAKIDGASQVPSLYIPRSSSFTQGHQQPSPSYAWNQQFEGGSASSTPRTQPPLSSRESRVGSGSGDMSRDFSYASLQSFQSDSANLDSSKILNAPWSMNGGQSTQGISTNSTGATSTFSKSRLTASAPEFIPSSTSASTSTSTSFGRVGTFSADHVESQVSPKATAKFSSSSTTPPPPPPPYLLRGHSDMLSGTSLPNASNSGVTSGPGGAFPSSLSSSYTSQGTISLPSALASMGLEGGNRSRHGSNHSGYNLFDNSSVTTTSELSPLSAHRSLSGGSASALFTSSNAMFMSPSADAVALSSISSLMGGLPEPSTGSFPLSSSAVDDSFAFGMMSMDSPDFGSGNGNNRSLPTFKQLGLGSSLGESGELFLGSQGKSTKLTF